MAKRGILPRRLANCPVPICTVCLYGSAKKRAWREKTSDKDGVKHVCTKPGEYVSVDQLISPTPGLVAQGRDSMTKNRYTTATVFVDHATDFGYVHVQKSASSEDTLEAKEAFERVAQEHGVQIRHYHADNRIFSAHTW